MDDIIFARRKSCECLGCGKCCKKLKKVDHINLQELLYNLIIKEAIGISCKDGNYENLDIDIPYFLKKTRNVRKTGPTGTIAKVNQDKLHRLQKKATRLLDLDSKGSKKNRGAQKSSLSLSKNSKLGNII